MKIQFRDPKLPHQLHVEVDSHGILYALCNCGEEFAKGKTLYGGVIGQQYRTHKEEVDRREAARQRAERFH